MERLTQRDENNIAYWDGKNGKSWSDKKGRIYGSAITKLTEYEDIGLTPEQIREVDKLYTEKCKELARYKKLEDQGRLLELPCKVGDTVWDIDCGKPYAYKITGYSFGIVEDYIDEPVKEDEIVYYCTDSTGRFSGSFASSCIGKAVFLTKEEAEQALRQEGE